MMTCDLHTHSIFSDGSDTPEQIIDSAIELSLSAVALCDHNTVDGLPAFLSAAEGKEIEAIPGAEFSVDHGDIELHLLGLFLPVSSFPQINQLLEEAKQRKLQSNLDLIYDLNRAGYRVDFETIQSSTPNGNFNRAHIARALTDLAYTASMEEAFETLLSQVNGFYKPPQRINFWDMLDFLTNIGAVPVLAHPFLQLDAAQLTALLPQAKERGLAGMECAYPLYDKATTALALELAGKFDLKYSGGSDYHGNKKPDIALGTGKANLKIPYEWAVRLKTHCRNLT